MNKEELRLLKSCVNNVVKSNKVAWDELKLQIHSYGYQPYYDAQSWFGDDAKREVLALSEGDKRMLISEWKKDTTRVIKLESDKEILNQYALVVVEKIVERARSAASRTLSWPADFDSIQP